MKNCVAIFTEKFMVRTVALVRTAALVRTIAFRENDLIECAKERCHVTSQGEA